MKLYHGTSAKYLDAILRDGIKPRGKGKGNWMHTVESNPDAVYLTNAYAIYFAGTAAKKGEKLVVLEIDTDKLPFAAFDMTPDEDWLEQTSRNQEGLVPAGQNKSMKARTRWFRKNLLKFHSYWKDALEGLGNCAYHGTIPPEAITRYAILSEQDWFHLVMAGIDPSITLLNYKLVGSRYRNSLKWLFGEGDLEQDLWGSIPFDGMDRLGEVREAA